MYIVILVLSRSSLRQKYGLPLYGASSERSTPHAASAKTSKIVELGSPCSSAPDAPLNRPELGASCEYAIKVEQSETEHTKEDGTEHDTLEHARDEESDTLTVAANDMCSSHELPNDRTVTVEAS